jgi:hypothetical protein
MLSEATRRQLLKFCSGELDASTFEAWVCADEELENQIGHGPHLDLIAADYRGREAFAEDVRQARIPNV